MRARIDWPSIGAAPSVEMATTIGERLTIVPNCTSLSSGRSMIFTIAPAARAASPNWRASSRSFGDDDRRAAQLLGAPAVAEAHDFGAGGGEKLSFPVGGGGCAHDDCFPAFQLVEQREVREMR